MTAWPAPLSFRARTLLLIPASESLVLGDGNGSYRARRSTLARFSSRPAEYAAEGDFGTRIARILDLLLLEAPEQDITICSQTPFVRI